MTAKVSHMPISVPIGIMSLEIMTSPLEHADGPIGRHNRAVLIADRDTEGK